MDREVFGADRSALLLSLEEGRSGIRARPGGAFGMWREGMRANYLGPVSAGDAEEGSALLRELIGSAPASAMFLDLPSENKAAVSTVEELGFESVRVLTRMYLGDNAKAGDPMRIFGLAEPGLG